MGNDPAFLFYPGDYLRDTQCLSENSQVAYDRIMCEHMRNICITQERLNFFIKRLNEDEKLEVMTVLVKIPGGFHIPWVTESITKRREYSESRRKNREGTTPKKKKKISKSYDSHMENEIENANEIDNADKNQLKEYDNWTEEITNGNDQFFEQLFMKEMIPAGDHIQFWIMDHRDLLNRYPKMRPPNQDAFRKSCIKHIRENYKKPINGNGKGKPGFDAQATLDRLNSYGQ